MTDTERLDFIEKHKIEFFWDDGSNQWYVSSEEVGGFVRWVGSSDLRTAIDEAMQEMRGLNNGRN